MIFDTQLLCSDAQVVTATAVSTNTIDLATTFDIGRGPNLRARAQIDTAFTRAAGALNTNFQLIQSANADLSAPDILYDSGAIAKATAVAGYIAIDIVVPRTTKRYLGFQYTQSAAGDGGAVTAGILLDTPTPVSDRPLGATGY